MCSPCSDTTGNDVSCHPPRSWIYEHVSACISTEDAQMGKPSHQHHEIPICCALIFPRELLFPAAWLLRLLLGGWMEERKPQWLWSEDEVEPLWDSVSLRMFFENSKTTLSRKNIEKQNVPYACICSNNTFMALLLDQEEQLTET